MEGLSMASAAIARVHSRQLKYLEKLGEKNREKKEGEKKEATRLQRRQNLLRDRLLSGSPKSALGAVGPQSRIGASPRTGLPPLLPGAEQRGSAAPWSADAVAKPPGGKRSVSADVRAVLGLQHSASARHVGAAMRRPAVEDDCAPKRPERPRSLEPLRGSRGPGPPPAPAPAELLAPPGGARSGSSRRSGTSLSKTPPLLPVAAAPELPEAQPLKPLVPPAPATGYPPAAQAAAALSEQAGGSSSSTSQPSSSPPPAFFKRWQKVSQTGVRDMAEWKKRNGHPADAKVFAVSGGYFDLRDALFARGWVENPDKESRFFDLKFGMGGDIHYESLLAHQIVNHYDKNREITTKSGLTQNLKNSRWFSDADMDEYYPRAFDLYDPLERADFVLDFQLTKAEAVLRGLLVHLERGHKTTFSKDVIRIALQILARSLQDLDDVIDQKKKAVESAFTVTADEWAILRLVSLDDVTQKLAGVPDTKALEATIEKKGSRRLSAPKEVKKADTAPAVKKKGKKKKKKSKKKDKLSAEEVLLSTSTCDFQDEDGQSMQAEVRSVLEQLRHNNPQSAINGCRNAWIIKPSGKSRGRGIQMLRELDEIFKATEGDECRWICQKYIEQPQIPHGFKFDIRQWVLVTNWNPLTVYMWKQPYIRFAGEKYDASLTDKNQYIHLVNNSIVKSKGGFQEEHSELGTAGFMWFRQQYEQWMHNTYCSRPGRDHHTPFLHAAPPYTCESFGVKQEDCYYVAKHEEDSDEEDTGKTGAGGAAKASSGDVSAEASAEPNPRRAQRYEPPEPHPIWPPPNKAAAEKPAQKDDKCACENLWDDCIVPQMESIVLCSLRSVMESIDNRANSVELFGYDFMLSQDPSLKEKPKVWLIEVNSSPAMDYSTHVTTPLVKKVMEDTAKVLVDLRENPAADTGEWQKLRHSGERQFVKHTVFNGKLELVGKAIRKKHVRKKKKKKTQKTKAADDAGQPPTSQQQEEHTDAAEDEAEDAVGGCDDGAEEDEEEAEDGEEGLAGDDDGLDSEGNASREEDDEDGEGVDADAGVQEEDADGEEDDEDDEEDDDVEDAAEQDDGGVDAEDEDGEDEALA
eukprot:TRINITY_DN24351_c0_g1_i1.p1 TRINITY_DN24351_c0_g1~~TRINITY_DN24351_c0_g1_i1.p1  ORF type:complete len:1087 (+),score=381.60 TRINITY_DN24351_c0_g1_i1:130-3390(+)